jgi:hypothetical protein
MAPDGQSFITSIATQQNAVWIHDSSGDRAISTEGYADAVRPVFSRDGKRLYYLLRRDSLGSPNELWRTDLGSGNGGVVLPGVSMNAFDISPDEKQVLFTQQPGGQPSQLWIASTDRSVPPRQIGRGLDTPHFGPKGEVYFRMAEGHALYAGVLAADGISLRKALPGPVSDFENVSPDGRFIVATIEVLHATLPSLRLVPLAGGAAMPICDLLCNPVWSQDGRYLSLQIADKSGKNPNARTAIIPLPPGEILPRLTPELIHEPAGWTKMPGVKVVDGINIAPGLDQSTYAYIKTSRHANLFRIPLQ